MSDLDVLLVTPPSRLEVYQNLSNDYAAIEPPVWSMLIAKYLISRNFAGFSEKPSSERISERILLNLNGGNGRI